MIIPPPPSAPTPLPPPLATAVATLSGDFFIPVILQDQNCFLRRKDGWEVLLELIPDKEVRGRLEEKWVKEAAAEMEDDEEGEEVYAKKGKTRSEERWDDLKREVKSVPKDTPRRVGNFLLPFLRPLSRPCRSRLLSIPLAPYVCVTPDITA